MKNLSSMPYEIILNIHEFLQINDVQKNRVILKFWNKALNSTIKWKIFLKRDFEKIVSGINCSLPYRDAYILLFRAKKINSFGIKLKAHPYIANCV